MSEESVDKPCICTCRTKELENFTLASLVHHYVEIPASTSPRRDSYYFEREDVQKLKGLLDVLLYRQLVIYCRDVENCQSLYEYLEDQNYPVISVHPEMAMYSRVNRYRAFTRPNSIYNILVTACCGHSLEMSTTVDVAIHFNEPDSYEWYCHRVSTRKMRKGLVLTFVRPKQKKRMMQIFENVTKAHQVEVTPIPDLLPLTNYLDEEQIAVEIEVESD